MIDDVIKEAETNIEHILNVLNDYKRDRHLLDKNVKRVSLELQGWEAYLLVLQEQRRRDETPGR